MVDPVMMCGIEVSVKKGAHMRNCMLTETFMSILVICISVNTLKSLLQDWLHFKMSLDVEPVLTACIF